MYYYFPYSKSEAKGKKIQLRGGGGGNKKKPGANYTSPLRVALRGWGRLWDISLDAPGWKAHTSICVRSYFGKGGGKLYKDIIILV